MRVQLQQLAAVAATPRTTWTFALLSDGEGTATAVELTLGDRSEGVAAALAELLAALRGTDLTSELQVTERLDLPLDRLRRDVVLATATSALRTAVAQLEAARSGASLHRFLGAEPTVSVELYANINRTLHATDRTPADFARGAARAVRAVRRGHAGSGAGPYSEAGRARAGAGAGGARRHWGRRPAAGRLSQPLHRRHGVADCRRRAPGWFDRTAASDLLRRLRVRVRGRLLAVSVIMPDIKHCGGVVEAVRAGRSALGRGGAFSLHSPSGPISLLASAHVTAAVPGALPLEHAVDEVDWRAELIAPAESIQAGRLLLPAGPGLGAVLDWREIRRRGPAILGE